MDFNTNVTSMEQPNKNISRNSIIKAINSVTSDSSKDDSVTFDKKQLEELNKAIEDINKEIKDSDNYISYDVHKDTNTIVVKLMDSSTDEIIREFPSVKNLDFIAKVREKVGLMFDTTQ